MDSNELMSAYKQEVEALARKAEEAKKQLKQLTGSLSSGDGAVSVTVNAAGALQQLSFGPKADEMPRTQLAALIISTARKAQIQAAQQVTTILAPLVGADSDAMRFVQEQIPVPEEPEGDLGTSNPDQRRIAYNEEQRDAYASRPQAAPAPVARFQPPPSAAPVPQQSPQHQQLPPQQPARRARPQQGDYEDEFGTGRVTREEDW